MGFARRTSRTGVAASVLAALLLGTAQAHAATGIPDVAEWSSNTNGVDCIQSLLDYWTGDQAGLAIDGSFGPATLQAVKNFQYRHSLVVDGIVGKHTGDALFQAASENAPADANLEYLLLCDEYLPTTS
jgi:peptidoglycan hydrolase-like protein with peptidoglycan-binding domain